MEITDGDYLTRFARTRDDQAFTELVRRHGPMVLGACRRVARDAQDAEDAFQAVFMTLAARATSLSGHPNVAGWLHEVARRVALRMRSARTARARLLPMGAVARTPDAVVDAWDERLDEALAGLPERYRAPVLLHHVEGLSQREVGARLGLRENAVAVRLMRARDMLRRKLERLGITVGDSALGVALAAAAAPADALTCATTNVAHGIAGGMTVAPPHIALLARQALATMRWAQVRIAAAAAMAVAVIGLAAAGAINAVGADGPVPADPEPPSAAAAAIGDWAARACVEAGVPLPPARHFLLSARLSRSHSVALTELEDLCIGRSLSTTWNPIRERLRLEENGSQRFGDVPCGDESLQPMLDFMSGADHGPACVGSPVLATLVSPWLDSGCYYAPYSLTRDGATFTLVVDAWTDDGQRKRNIPSRWIELVSLGELPRGVYVLRVVERGFQRLGEERTYSLRAVRSCKAEFEVGPAGAARATQEITDLSPIPPADLASVMVSQTGRVPPAIFVRTPPAPAGGAPVAVGLGRWDLSAWLGDSALPNSDGPPWAEGETNGSLVVRGPALPSGSRIVMRDAFWSDSLPPGEPSVLHVRLGAWRAATSGTDLVVPVIVLPLTFLPSGRIQPCGVDVSVEMSWYEEHEDGWISPQKRGSARSAIASGVWTAFPMLAPPAGWNVERREF